MKRNHVLLLICILAFAGTVSAQPRLYFGVNGTMMSTWTTGQMNYGKPDMDYKFTFNPAGNVNIGYDFNKNLGLILAPGYAVLGQKYEDLIHYESNNTDTAFSRRVSMGYFVLPVMFKYRSSGEVVRFYVAAGPQFNFLIKAKEDYFRNDDLTTESVYNPKINDWVKIGDDDITDRFESFDIMARVDVGAEFTLIDNLFLTAGFSMAYGLTDINDPNWQYPNPDSGEYNPSHNLYGGFTVGINYCFNPKKSK